MMDKLVTVIGGGGFVGRYVVQALLAAGARVRVAQRDPRDAVFLKPQGGLGQTQFVAVDVTKPDLVARAIAGSDAVVNLVGTLAGNFQGLQVDGARNVAQAAAEAGVAALVHVSAIGADAGAPAAYARTKGEGEAAVRAAFPRATILRPSIIFGREDKFVNRFAQMMAMPVVPVLRAKTLFQPIYVGDVAQCVMKALTEPDSYGGKTFELGGPDRLSMGDLIRWIAQATGRTPAIVDLPDFAGAMIARAGFLPGAPITWDQWLMLQNDNVVSPGSEGMDAFGVTPTPMGTVAPRWLVRFRRNGRFGTPIVAD